MSCRKKHSASTARCWGVVMGGLWGEPLLGASQNGLGLGIQNRVGTALSHQAGSGNKGNELLSQA